MQILFQRIHDCITRMRKKTPINFMLDKHFYDAWLSLQKFSKLMKIGVNLRVPNGSVFKIPVKYGIKYQSM